MKRLMYVALSMYLFLLVGCNTAPPSKIIKDFYGLCEKGKVNDAFALLSKPTQSSATALAGGAAALSNITKLIESQKGIKEVQIVSEDVKGDTAVISVKVILNSGNPHEEKHKFIKEDGKWKMTDR